MILFTKAVGNNFDNDEKDILHARQLLSGLGYSDQNFGFKFFDMSARSPRFPCTQCGGWNGGSEGELCPDCFVKQG